MSADSLEVHPPIHSKGSRKNKQKRDELTTISETINDQGRAKSTRIGLCEGSSRLSGRKSPLRPPSDRIHSAIPSKPRTAPSTIYYGLSRASSGKENRLPTSKLSAVSSSRPDVPQPGTPPEDPNIRMLRPAHSARSPILKPPGQLTTRGPLTITFSDNIPLKPSRSVPPSSIQPPSSSFKRRCEVSATERHRVPASNQTSVGTYQVHASNTTMRNAQGHKTLPHSHGRSSSTSRIEPRPVTTRDFDCHRREVHAAVSSLGPRIGALENTVAAALPIVAEARLLWMENTVVKAPTKLGTTRRALCEYYGHPKYSIYTGRIRARAYYLGLTLNDLEYLQERLDSLGDQSSKQEALLISPFGGGNESGDKTMVDAYRRDSKHGIYARHIWRVCYERAYSVDENWSVPVPVPDNSKLVDKIKGWLSSGA